MGNETENSCGAQVPASLPFSIDRADSRSLIDQVVDGIREGVLSGFYREGEKLPSIRQLAKQAGVSLIVPKLAIRRLEREGVVVTRPRIGTVVRCRGETVWRGRVVLLIPESYGNFCVNVVSGVMRNILAEDGYRLEAVTVPLRADGTYDFRFAELALKQATNLVVMVYNRPAVLKFVRARRIPFVVFGEAGDVPGALGGVWLSSESAARAFVRRCLATGAKRVLEIGFCREGMGQVTDAVRQAGLCAESWMIPNRGDVRRHDCVSASVVAAFERRLGRGRDWLPDVIFFNDDFVATGGLMALAHHGVRIPEDVGVVSFANRGLGPVFYRRLTMFENDSVRVGQVFAGAILRWLEKGVWDGALDVDLQYVPGETF